MDKAPLIRNIRKCINEQDKQPKPVIILHNAQGIEYCVERTTQISSQIASLKCVNNSLTYNSKKSWITNHGLNKKMKSVKIIHQK